MPAGDPIFKSVFGKDWDNLPPVMKKHYAVRSNSHDRVVVKGRLDIKISPMVSLMARISGMLLAYSGKNIPVTVVFRSDHKGSSSTSNTPFYFDRTFHFPDRGDITFRSRMEQIENNILVEFMRFGIGWKLAYEWDGKKVILRHKGYVWQIFGKLLPLPFSWIMGKGYAEETPLSDDTFSMWTHAKHSLFGPTFGYAGDFKVTEVKCPK
ncbi:DUF4166 domain-containing protein [Kiloniella sp.]|uniref:DUF4166 domain-containing protein n=1 Tax=Kiloniella sp. TaxID=1938587 RepID=UPI003A91F657